jgi:hypothetical protein
MSSFKNLATFPSIFHPNIDRSQQAVSFKIHLSDLFPKTEGPKTKTAEEFLYVFLELLMKFKFSKLIHSY